MQSDVVIDIIDINNVVASLKDGEWYMHDKSRVCTSYKI